MIRMNQYLLVGLLLLTLQMRTFGDESAMKYRSPDYFKQRGKLADFIPYSRNYLQVHSGDPQTAHVLLDLWMTAAAVQDADAVSQAQSRLLLDCHDSIPTLFLLKTLKADDVRKILSACFRQSTTPLDHKTRFRLSRAIDTYHKQFGASTDDEFNAQGAISTDNRALAQSLRGLIKNPASDAAKVVDLILDNSLSAQEKFLGLQKYPQFPSARAYQAYIYAEDLTAAERQETAVELVTLANLLQDSKFAEALPRLKALRQQLSDPRVGYWQGWAEGATGATEAAVRTLNDVQADFPGSPYEKSAQRMAQALAALEESQVAHLELTNQICRALVGNLPDVLEARLQYTPKNSLPLAAYIAVDFSQDGLEVMAHRNSQALVAYRAAPNECRYFLAGDAEIQTYTGKGFCPVFQCKMQPKLGGGYDWGINFNTTQQGQFGLHKSVRTLLAMPYFVSAGTREELLHYLISKGSFPEPMVTENGSQQMRWILPQLDQPELTILEIRVSADYHVESVTASEAIRVTEIRYGSREIKLSPPAWPNLPLKRATELGATDLFRIFGAVASWFEEKPLADANVAGQPKLVK